MSRTPEPRYGVRRLPESGRVSGATDDDQTTAALDSSADGMWTGRIRQAFRDDRFELFAQPIVDLATSEVVWSELLLRLRSRFGRIVLPAEFLPTAERRGLIREIDDWVVSHAIDIAAGGQPVTLNLSAASVGHPAALEGIERELLRARPDPGTLVFEITETTVIHDLRWAKHVINRLAALGCQVALDDFGTGFASLRYLKHLPVDLLKIDAEFVQDLSRDRRDRSVVSAIVALAGGFGQRTIAEGVEDLEVAEVLRSLGVDFAQGFLFGGPVPQRDLPEEVTRPRSE